ncbi:acanthoscurrin-1-like isoform X2 [Mercenaria mercenaria]|uniref:acanthoscurrin-1-like isoform X2 n=1 Tax=Mercenaria mercenaria TaxID=6596 RepID=UPI00234E7CE0|nr:acanthoscurrin-1-like isoform X2 [Mercenaria mercenaria]
MAAQCQTNTINTGPNFSHATVNGEAHRMKAIIVISALLAVAIASPMWRNRGNDDSWRYGRYGGYGMIGGGYGMTGGMIGGGMIGGGYGMTGGMIGGGMIGGGYGMTGGGYGGYGGYGGGYGMNGGIHGMYPGMHMHYYWKRRPY